MEPCQIDVTVADGSTILATNTGKVTLLFTSDQGKETKLVLHRVLYVAGLSKRLFLAPSFCSNKDYTMSISANFTQLDFGDGTTLTLPILKAGTQANTSEEAISETNKIKPLIPMEMAHLKIGHNSIRSLMAGSLHQVWLDYKLAPKTDEFCEGCKIATSRSAVRQHIGTPTPDICFLRVYGDIIYHPIKQDLTKSTTFPCSLLLVCAYCKFGWLQGMKDFSSKAVIECFKMFLAQTGSKTSNLLYFRTYAGTSFTPSEFKDFSQEQKFSVTFAAPHHLEQNSMSERYWQSIDNMDRSMRVHACLPMQFFYQLAKYTYEISNALPGKNLKNEEGEPTTTFFLAFKVKQHLGKFKVFGYPAIFKRHEPFHKGKKITKKIKTQRGSCSIFVGFPPQQAGALIYVQDKIGPNNSTVSQDVTYDEHFNSAVACITVPFQGELPEKPIGHNSWDRDYDPDREKAATGSAADINPSSQEEEQQTYVLAPIDVPSANTRSRRLVFAVPDKVPNSDMELAAQAYEKFSD
eukprot:15347910-Ditylum_brightwellii.AAC.1